MVAAIESRMRRGLILLIKEVSMSVFIRSEMGVSFVRSVPDGEVARPDMWALCLFLPSATGCRTLRGYLLFMMQDPCVSSLPFLKAYEFFFFEGRIAVRSFYHNR